uniref:Uncharacterized protein n=1 Tax=Heliothis virescens TaxID=7102 RepID=A0A2A4IZU0_HELVI
MAMDKSFGFVDNNENTYKQYYYSPLSPHHEEESDDIVINNTCDGGKRKSQAIDHFFEVEPKIKKNKLLSSTVARTARDGVSYISTNSNDGDQATHLIKIEMYDMKKLLCTSAFFSTSMEDTMELFNSELDQELYKVCEDLEKRELFDSSYDDELYNQCSMVETQFNQPLQLGRGMKRTSSEEPKIIKKPRMEEEASTSAGASVGNDDQVECPTCHMFIKKRLDIEMQNIMNSKTEDRKKWMLYLQTLQRYLHFTEEDRQPLRLPIYSDTFNVDSNESKIGFKNKDRDTKSSFDVESLLDESVSIKSKENEVNSLYTPTQILSLIPKTYNKKGQLLLNFVGKSKIHWDNEGVVIIDNEKIPGSNIVDLINDTLRPLKRSDPIGWDRFAKALKDIKVPLTYIGNPKRCEFITQLQAKDLDKTSEIEVQEFSTPSSGDKRSMTKIRKKLDWEKWTPY